MTRGSGDNGKCGELRGRKSHSRRSIEGIPRPRRRACSGNWGNLRGAAPLERTGNHRNRLIKYDL